MGEIRIVGPGKTRRYPYPVCKNIIEHTIQEIVLKWMAIFSTMISPTFIFCKIGYQLIKETSIFH